MLDLLRAAGSPVGVREIADQTGLHPNTARFHLDALVDAGLATRASKERTTPGRPSMAYQAVAGGESHRAAALPPARRDAHQPDRGHAARPG